MRKVKSVSAIDNYELRIVFDTGEAGIFDAKPYLERGIFTQLKDPDYFGMVRVFLDSIAWPNGQDFDPDHLYLESAFKGAGSNRAAAHSSPRS